MCGVNLEHCLLLVVHGSVDIQGPRLFINRKYSHWLLIHSFPIDIKVYLIVAVNINLKHKSKHFAVGFWNPAFAIYKNK